MLRRGLQQRRYAGSGDRQAISALFWTIYRAAARIGWHLEQLGAESTPRTYVLAGLRLGEGMARGRDCRAVWRRRKACAASARAMTRLRSRTGWKDAASTMPSMPRAVRLEWPEALVADAEAALGDAHG
ncbi:MAG: hypothetical protein CM15mP115_22880 [Alphaproteobacteria bacterium]|nr:MAG: hypothetical protein CM15mP115_22880 [Alphaproteobacteria bacterium]